MFYWTGKVVTSGDLVEALRRGLNQSTWGNTAIYVLPVIASAPDVWSGSALDDAGLQRHLRWALRSWSAFRNASKAPEGSNDREWRQYDQVFQRLAANLWDSIEPIQTAIARNQWSSLADLREPEIRDFIVLLDRQFAFLGTRAKGNESRVIGSKAGHFLFPQFIPAYDNEQIASKIERILKPRNGEFTRYMELSWWLLKQFSPEDLARARELVKRHLLDDWIVRALRVNLGNDVLSGTMDRLDSLVSEYTILGIGLPESPRTKPLVRA